MLGQRQGVLVMKVCRACQGHRHSAGRCWLSQTQKLLAWKSRTQTWKPEAACLSLLTSAYLAGMSAFSTP